jgi:hypothetical protein
MPVTEIIPLPLEGCPVRKLWFIQHRDWYYTLSGSGYGNIGIGSYIMLNTSVQTSPSVMMHPQIQWGNNTAIGPLAMGANLSGFDNTTWTI